MRLKPDLSNSIYIEIKDSTGNIIHAAYVPEGTQEYEGGNYFIDFSNYPGLRAGDTLSFTHNIIT